MPKENRINLAIIAPHHRAQTESFIEAHERFIDANVFFYHGIEFPTFLNGKNLTIKSIWEKNINYSKRRFFNDPFSEQERDLLKSFRQKKIQAVLAEYGMSGVRVMKVSDKLQIPLFVHFHGNDAHNIHIEKQYRESYQVLFRKAKNIFSVSNYMTEALIKLGCPKEKTILNTYGPREEFFQITPDYDSNNFLSVGRFVNKKAPYYTIMAFWKVVYNFPNAHLNMVGDGPLLETCQNIVTYLGLKKSVTFHGMLDRAEIISLMKHSSGFVQHSIIAQDGDTEGTPVAILEAAAAALPIVATRHAGIVDVIQEDITGLLVEEHDVDGMAVSLKKIALLKKEEKKKMGEASRKYILKNFNISRHIKNIENQIYNSLDL